MDKSQEIIKEYFDKLPKAIQEAITAIDFREKIRIIADKNKLHIDQAGYLENETALVMLGLEPSEDYKDNLKRELVISDDMAQAIIADVDKEIFAPIRESMKRAHEQNLATGLPSSEVGIKAEQQLSNVSEQKDVLENSDRPQLEKISDQKLKDETRRISLETESEEVRHRIANQQQQTKHTAPPPPNLPTGIAQETQQSDKHMDVSLEKEKEGDLHTEKKKQYSIDPYREPIE